jgi:hypothetical protein
VDGHGQGHADEKDHQLVVNLNPSDDAWHYPPPPFPELIIRGAISRIEVTERTGFSSPGSRPASDSWGTGSAGKVGVNRWLSGFLDSWTIIKDVVLTAGGLTLIMWQVFAVPDPSDAVIITGLAMSGIGASFHVSSIIGGFIGKPSGSSSPPGHGPPPPSTTPE